jgi:glutathione peroxidase
MDIWDIVVKDYKDEDVKLDYCRRKVLLVVNTAIASSYSAQYLALEKLYRSYHDFGLEILDFPCNQFGNDAPWTSKEMHDYCVKKFHVSFNQFAKVDVNGVNESPIFSFLKDNSPQETVNGKKNKVQMKSLKAKSDTCKRDGDIIWNFTKFLIDKKGNVVMRLATTENPMLMEDKIRRLLAE